MTRAALERLCARFTAAHVQRFFDRWIYRLPNPFTAKDRRAGYTYQLSLLRLENVRIEARVPPTMGGRIALDGPIPPCSVAIRQRKLALGNSPSP